MFGAVLQKYFQIAKLNLKHNYAAHVLVSVLLLCIAPAVFSVSNSDAKTSAVVLEMFISLIGIIILTPLYLPEQQNDIRELIESKYTSQTGIYLVRITISIFIILIFTGCFIFTMLLNGCTFNSSQYIFGTFASAIFLGSVGMFIYGLLGNITTGYMASIGYYVFNIFGGSRHMGKLYLFSMMNGSFEEKYWLLSAGAFLIACSLLVKVLQRRLG